MTMYQNHATLSELSLDQLHTTIQEELTRVQEAGRITSLETYHAQRQRQKKIRDCWQSMRHLSQKIEEAINTMPILPVWNQIVRAQTLLAFPNLAFLEIDTTGLEADDEMIRFTLLDVTGEVVEDCLMQPVKRTLGAQASQRNGIKPAQLIDALPMGQAWERIQQALCGRYVISFGLEWDETQLSKTATQHGLSPVFLLGECLQRFATAYYHREYSLRLAELSARVGSPLPDHPNQSSLDRARGQRAVLQAFAQAITDVRPPMISVPKAAHQTETLGVGDDFDPFLDSDALP